MTLNDLPLNSSAKVIEVGGEGALRQHFLDMGILPGATVTVIKFAPMGDPMEILIHGYSLTIRVADAQKIKVAPKTHKVSLKEEDEEIELFETPIDHPGFGEGGRYHDSKNETPLPENEKLTFALVGNQNSGKTTLFNQLTGSNQHVGNFPGVTVDRKDGIIKGHPNTLVTDLPGIYSMSPYSSEEVVTREFVLKEKPKGIINIVDATNIERNLYLTMQLIELDIPMVLALNMMDEVRNNHGSIHINELEELLGIPVVPISAAKNEGVGELIDHLIHTATYQEKPRRTDFCSKNNVGGAVHRSIHAVMHLIEDHAERADIPIRFAASKLLEGDSLVLNHLQLDENEEKLLKHLTTQMENESGLDRSAAMADMRYRFINCICSQTVVKPQESKEHERSRKADKILTGKYTAIPLFILIMGLVFWLSFNVIGAFFQGVLEDFIGWLTTITDHALSLWHVNEVLHRLIIEGIFTGVGSVLSFLPIIVTLFFFLSILEDSGYMARVAFVMDKLLRKIGLSGRSVVPMLIGFGCTVPGVMASRTLPSERDRKMTILLTPFMSCSAKVPIYAFFAAAFFPGHGALVMISLYLLGIIIAILVALLFRQTMFKGDAVPFVLELPNYRMPGAKSVLLLLWQKAKDFMQKAFTIIFIATIVIWFLQSFDPHLNLITDSSASILAKVGGVLAPIFKPMGYGDWRISTALITGFMAKESVVSTLNVLFGSRAAIASLLTPLSVMALLVFCLLYTPCVAAVSAVKRELGGLWTIIMVVGQCVIAWIVSFIVYTIGYFIGF